ncbi:MAG: alpha/beta hydrolase [Alphaproteobacteria bacterium]|nr:alpha/beta hydrolase [Alphaproteobacteria bacterium]
MIFLASCAGMVEPPDSYTRHDVKTTAFTLMTYQKITDRQGAVKVYIEGDGRAFDGRGRPTDDPTPRNDFMRMLAFKDTSKNVVYLGRPCQYVNDEMCRQSDWTTARFSDGAVRDSAEAIMRIAEGREVILVGFSGGAQIAGLVAVRHPETNVKKLITISGNLDHAGWTSGKNFAPLNESLDLSSYRKEYLEIPQIHYVGGKDTVIPINLTAGFLGAVAPIVIIPNAGHGTGFEDIYHDIWDEI